MRRALPAAIAATALGIAACGAGPAREPQLLRVAVNAGGLVDRVATGVPVGPDTVLTVAHVLDGALTVSVGGRRATVMRANPGLDIALLRINGVHLRTSPVGIGRPVRRIVLLRDNRDEIAGASLIRRVTARVQREPGRSAADVRPALELSAAVEPGDSGAPVTDGDGRVVGMIFADSNQRPNTAWAVDATAIVSMLDRR